LAVAPAGVEEVADGEKERKTRSEKERQKDRQTNRRTPRAKRKQVRGCGQIEI